MNHGQLPCFELSDSVTSVVSHSDGIFSNRVFRHVLPAADRPGAEKAWPVGNGLNEGTCETLHQLMFSLESFLKKPDTDVVRARCRTLTTVP